MPTGFIEINNLRIYAYHGVLKQENRIGNYFDISMKLRYPISRAMINDSLAETLNYAEVIDIIKTTMQTPSHLIENVIERIKKTLLARFPLIESGQIKIEKLSPPIANTQLQSVAVIYEW